MTDYEKEDITCPNCQHFPIHWRRCECENGWIDAYDNDPINYSEGEYETRCLVCSGTGIERWCPGCGTDLSDIALEEEIA